MKKKIALLLSFALGLGLAACGGSTNRAKPTDEKSSEMVSENQTEAAEPETQAAGEDEASTDDIADVVYENALFYTEDEDMPEASVMAVKDGKILYIGDDAGAFKGEQTQVVDLEGAFVTPPFIFL